LPVGRKLAFGFGAIIALAIALGVTNYVTGVTEEKQRVAADEALQHVQLADNGLTFLLQARRREKDFLLRYRDEGYDTAFQNYALIHQRAIEDSLGKFAELRAQTEPVNYDKLDQIVQFTTTYRDSYQRVLDGVKLRGAEGKDGLVFAAFGALDNLDAVATGTGVAALVSSVDEAKAALVDYDLLMLPGTQVKDNDKAVADYARASDRLNKSLDAVSAQIAVAELADPDRSSLQADLIKARAAVGDLLALDGQLLDNRNAFQTTVDKIEPVIIEVTANETQDYNAQVAAYQATRVTNNVISAAVLGAALLVSVALTLIVTGSLTRQINALKPVFSAIRVGDFDTRARVFSQDELGRATTDINALLDYMINLLRGSLARMESVVQSAPDAIILVNQERNIALFNPAAESIFGIPSATALGMSVGQIAPRLLQVINAQPAAGGTAMRQSLELTGIRADGTQIPMEGTVSSVEVGGETLYTAIVRDVSTRQELQSNVTGMVELLVNQATSSAAMAEQATGSAQQGTEAVTATIAAMGRIRDNTQETARRIKRLGEVSSEIGEAVRLIEELADRTTVLALNASIQAASAGEAGRGFAVVAEEVQRLAERATGTTRQIEGLVKNIQAETSEAVIGIEEATREVVDGSALAQQTGDRVSELSRLVSDLASLIQHVAATTATQTTESLAALTSGVTTDESASGGNGHTMPVPTR